MCARHFATPAWMVDRMELWQVIAYFTPDDAEERQEATPDRSALSSRDVIRERLRAHREGLPEPLHIFGDVDMPN